MKSTPYIWIWASKLQACGASKKRRDMISQTMRAVSPTMSQAKSWPKRVLILSMVKRIFCIVTFPGMGAGRVCSNRPSGRGAGRPTGEPRLGLLPGEEVVQRHLHVHQGVGLPATGAGG